MDLIDHPIFLPSSPTSNLYHDRPLDTIDNNISDTGDDHSVSVRNSSGPDEAVFDDDYDNNAQTRQSSPHTSDDDISELPGDSRAPSCVLGTTHQLPYTPHKTRSPFRNPSSVIALQLEDTTPPHFASGSSSRQQHRYRLNTPSHTSTPRSTCSYHSTTRSLRSPTRKPAQRKEYPLVLLHVTLLPIPTPYSLDVMSSLLPPSTISNWKLLHEKVSATVLDRGILIPHPREDYDLLEERLLESLELRIPRILKCGHFHLSPEEEADAMAASDEDHDYDDDSDPGDADICLDCNRRIRDGKLGATGTGNKRWDIRIYAANGLMRAGAWSAAWREMERVDVEIWPWINEEVRRELDARQEEVNIAAAAATEMTLLEERERQQEALLRGSPSPKMDEERRKEIYGEGQRDFEEAEGSLHGTLLRRRPPPFRMPSTDGVSHTTDSKYTIADPPLSKLLTNYLSLLLRDTRNLALLTLSLLVLFLALRPIVSYLVDSPSSPLSSPALPPLVSDGLKAEPATVENSVFITVTEVKEVGQKATRVAEVISKEAGGEVLEHTFQEVVDREMNAVVPASDSFPEPGEAGSVEDLVEERVEQ